MSIAHPWSGKDTDEHHASICNLSIGAALLAGLFSYVMLVGTDETVTLKGVNAFEPGSKDRVLVTDSSYRYFLPGDVRTDALQPGCRYRINSRPDQFGKSPSRDTRWRIVKGLTRVGCP